MSMTDPLADMLTRIRNGQKSKLLCVKCPYSKIKESVLKVLLEEGYISSYSLSESGVYKIIEIFLKFDSKGNGAIFEISRVSKPGKRETSSIKDLSSYYNGLGIYILTTSRGILSDRKARLLGVGGEIICKVF